MFHNLCEFNISWKKIIVYPAIIQRNYYRRNSAKFCRIIIPGNYDNTPPFFTENGSFWLNNVTAPDSKQEFEKSFPEIRQSNLLLVINEVKKHGYDTIDSII